MNAENMQEDYAIYHHQGRYHVQGTLSRRIIHESSSASEAVACAVEQFDGHGGEVRLHRGEYVLDREITLASRVWLRGSGRGTVLIVDDDNTTGIGVLCRNTEGVVVSDLAVLAAGRRGVSGIVIENSGDCQVRDVGVSGFAGYGIWLRNNSFLCELKSCKASENRKANIYLSDLWEGGRGGDFPPNLLTDCITYGGGHGFELKASIVVNIVGCSVFQCHGHAFYVHSLSNSVLISGSRSFQCDQNAVLVEEAHEFNASSNIFCWHRGHGIELKNATWAAINGNEVIDTGCRHASDAMVGVLLRDGTQGVQVVGNSIFNWGDQAPMKIAVHEDASCLRNIVMANNINFCTQCDVLSEGRGTLVRDNVSRIDKGYLRSECEPMYDFDMKRMQRFTSELYRRKNAAAVT